MNYIAYTARFLYRIKWWLILAPIIVALAVFFKMGAQPRNYKSMTTVYTGIVSGYDITTTEGTRQDWNIINNAMDNLINIILSQTTLKNVSMRLYAQGLTHLDPDNDNQYLTARTSRYLLNRTPKEVMDLVDRTSEEKTLENLRRFEEADHDNHVYGMFHWNPPYYSYQALSQIKVKRITSSDMLEISYENDDPYIVYNTLVILNDEFVRQYRDLRFGETNSIWVIVNNSPQMDVLPTAGDHNVYGGLYRDVELIVTEQSVIRASEGGIRLVQKAVSSERAAVDAVIRIDGQRDRNLLVNLAVTTPRRDTIFFQASRFRVPASGIGTVTIPIELESPTLWNGVENPYLYNVIVKVTDQNVMQLLSPQHHVCV